jgi:hypothetical protein
MHAERRDLGHISGGLRLSCHDSTAAVDVERVHEARWRSTSALVANSFPAASEVGRRVGCNKHWSVLLLTVAAVMIALRLRKAS